MFRFESIVILLLDDSSFTSENRQISNSFKTFVTPHAFSYVRYKVALVSRYPNSPKRSVILYNELLFICSAITSKFVFFAYLMVEIVTLYHMN